MHVTFIALTIQTRLGKLISKQSNQIISTTSASQCGHSELHPTTIMPATTAETLSLVNRTVSVAPLVLLSAADHYGRSVQGTRKRVVGVLLGQNDGKNVRVSNSFAGMGNRCGNSISQNQWLTFPYSSIRGGRERSISLVLGP